MKKLIVIIVFIAGFSLSMMAQVVLKPQIGLNMSVPIVADNNFTQISGLAGQWGVSLLLGKKFYVEPGVIWANYKNKVVLFEGDEGHDLQYSVLKIPVFAGFHIVGNSKSFFDLRLFAGPSMSILLKNEDNSFRDEYMKNTSFSVNGGLGLSVWFIFFDIGYEYGITDIYVQKEDGYNNSMSVNNIWFNLGARIRF